MLFYWGGRFKENNQTGGVRVDMFLQLFWGVNRGCKIRRGPPLSDKVEQLCIWDYGFCHAVNLNSNEKITISS